MLEKTDVTMYSTDASFSWKGYNYQGKVGLLVALKKIEEIRISEEDLADYSLELEWLEDFSIKKIMIILLFIKLRLITHLRYQNIRKQYGLY